MKVLLDQGVPAPLRDSLSLDVSTCYEMGWASLSNGDLLSIAEQQFDIFVTTDKNLQYQQNLVDRKIAIFVLPTTQWPSLSVYASIIGEAISLTQSGEFIEWNFPHKY